MQCGVPMAVSQYANFPVKYSLFYENKGGLNVIIPQFGQGILVYCDPLTQMATVQLHDGLVTQVHASQVTMHMQHKIPATYEEFLELQKLKHGNDVYKSANINPLKRVRGDDGFQQERQHRTDMRNVAGGQQPISGHSCDMTM